MTSRLLFVLRAAAAEAGRWTDAQLNLTDGFNRTMDGRLLERVDEVYGCHLWNYATPGTVGCAAGSVTANSDSVLGLGLILTVFLGGLCARCPNGVPGHALVTAIILLPCLSVGYPCCCWGHISPLGLEIEVTGTGGHGSAPHGTVDPVVVAAQFIMAAQCIVSRNTSPTESAVVTFGRIDGGVAPNVIATSVTIMGTVRTFTMPVKRMVQTRLQEIAAGIAASHGPSCGITVKFLEGYPACVNSKDCADNVVAAG